MMRLALANGCQVRNVHAGYRPVRAEPAAAFPASYRSANT